MKAYMVYSRTAGSQEGAALVFAHTVREARIIGWHSCGWEITDEYIDLAARWLRDSPWLMSQKLGDEPHVIDAPKCCDVCQLWGRRPYTDRICCDCADEIEVGLVHELRDMERKCGHE